MTERTIWAVVPAAGVGKRMQSSLPKQYLPLEGRPVIEHTLNTLLDSPHISGLVIALGEADEYWPAVELTSSKPVLTAPGGRERADSVHSALDTLAAHLGDDFDQLWVMVHDAVRPCLRQSDIDALVEQVGADEQGGILARPVRDTMKRQLESADRHMSDAPAIETTVSREGLWHALTPQYFPAASLREAIAGMLKAAPGDLTDEASAMERAGYAPRLVHGYEDNIKITHADDLRMAGLFMREIRKLEQ